MSWHLFPLYLNLALLSKGTELYIDNALYKEISNVTKLEPAGKPYRNLTFSECSRPLYSGARNYKLDNNLFWLL
jgi:hypothetical protein